MEYRFLNIYHILIHWAFINVYILVFWNYPCFKYQYTKSTCSLSAHETIWFTSCFYHQKLSRDTYIKIFGFFSRQSNHTDRAYYNNLKIQTVFKSLFLIKIIEGMKLSFSFCFTYPFLEAKILYNSKCQSVCRGFIRNLLLKLFDFRIYFVHYFKTVSLLL